MIDEKIQSQLRAQYNPEGSLLRNQQTNMLEILKIIVEICEKHKITYWLASGTLLGAIRHGGFIPWDDDIDIEILYSDKKRFIQACINDLPKNFVIQCHQTDNSYYLDILKVRNQDIYINESCNIGKHKYDTMYNYGGLFVDVFTVEPSALSLVKLANFLTKILLFFRYVLKFPRIIVEVIYYINHLIFNIFRLIVKLLRLDKFYYHSYGSLFFSSRNIHDLLPTQKGLFENVCFNIPNDSDAYLKKIYGDYMTMPDDILKKPHHNNEL